LFEKIVTDFWKRLLRSSENQPCAPKKSALREGENLPYLTGNPALIFPATCPDFFIH
jgi:hypothetical protein